METKKLAASSAAMLALVTGSFVAGQKAGQPTATARVAAISFEPVPSMVLIVRGPEGLRRRRVTCDKVPHLDGKPAPSLASICDPLQIFAKTAADKVGSMAEDLAK